MKLNDPFGRMERRHQMGYETMREAMRREGVTTESGAREIIRLSRIRALKVLVFGLLLLAVVTVLIPKALPLSSALALFLLVWLAVSTVNGRRYIERYIDEDLKT